MIDIHFIYIPGMILFCFVYPFGYRVILCRSTRTAQVLTPTRSQKKSPENHTQHFQLSRNLRETLRACTSETHSHSPPQCLTTCWLRPWRGYSRKNTRPSLCGFLVYNVYNMMISLFGWRPPITAHTPLFPTYLKMADFQSFPTVVFNVIL